jgi:hypothetical protein
MGRSRDDPGNELSEARELAGRLDLDHAPDPGGLEEIGTCRTCGLLIARDGRGVWSHQPAVGEIDSAEAWLDHHPGAAAGRPEPTGSGVARDPSSTPS